MSLVFESFLSTPDMLDVLNERDFVAAMLQFEAALASAQASVGLIPAAAAQTIRSCCRVDAFDVPQLLADSSRAGSVAIPLIRALKDAVGRVDPAVVPHTHVASTSQDVIDTALALVTQRALGLIERDTHRAVAALHTLAASHAGDPVLARTLMQPASVTSFGLKCIGWAAPLVRSLERLQRTRDQALSVQLGGAVGTGAQMHTLGPEVVALVAAELGLRAAPAVWHTQRDEWVALGCELGLLVGSLGKVAKDLSLMGQFEVAEVAEPTEAGRGGSSAMPHKRNPVACMATLAASVRAPQRVAALLAAMPQEHERALGPWQAELAEWPGLLLAAHGAVHAMAQMLPGLQVDTLRMRANLDAVRAVLPPDAANEWFDPALAGHAAQLTHTQLARQQTALASLHSPSKGQP